MRAAIFKRKYRVQSIFVIVTMIIAVSCCIGCVVPEGSKVGDNAPDFTLATLDGGQVTLSQLRGKPVILTFWTTECSACIYQMPFLQAANDDVGNDIEFINIDIMENSYTVQSLINYYNFDLPVALDSDGTVTEAYNVIYTPTNVIIDKQGVIHYVRKGAFSSTAEILAAFSNLE